MSAMTEMSRAIRHVIEDHCPLGDVHLSALTDEALHDFVLIVTALGQDLETEEKRRAKVSAT